jgi:hypothetical protein
VRGRQQGRPGRDHRDRLPGGRVGQGQQSRGSALPAGWVRLSRTSAAKGGNGPVRALVVLDDRTGQPAGIITGTDVATW